MRHSLTELLKKGIRIWPFIAAGRILLEIALRYPGNHGPGVEPYYPWFLSALAATAVIWICERTPPCRAVVCVSFLTFVLFFAADRLNIALTYEEWIQKGQPRWGQYRTRLVEFNREPASVAECETVLARNMGENLLLITEENPVKSDLHVLQETSGSVPSKKRYLVVDGISETVRQGDLIAIDGKGGLSIGESIVLERFLVVTCATSDIHAGHPLPDRDGNKPQRTFTLSGGSVSSFERYWMERGDYADRKGFCFESMLLAFYRLKKKSGRMEQSLLIR